MKSFLPFVGLALLGGGLLASSGCGKPTAAESALNQSAESARPLDRVTAGKPQRKTLELYTSQPGRIEAFEETPLFPKITGYVDEIKVDIGDRVKKDQILITLWVPELHDELKQKEALVTRAEAQVRQAEAAWQAALAAVDTAEARVTEAKAGIRRAEADFERWQSEYERIKDLTARGSLTQKLADESLNQLSAAEASRDEVAANVQSAEAALAEARANVKKAEADQVAAAARAVVAQAEKDQAQTMLEYTEIKAPFDGVVTRRNVNTRHYVHPASGGMTKPLLVVAQTKTVRIFVDVPELEAPLVDGGERGDKAVIRVQSLRNREFGALVTRTSWSLDTVNRSLCTEIDIENKDGLLRPGMYATADILLERRENVLTLPASALVREGREAYVCCVESGTVRRVPVKLGLQSGEDVEILEGLAENQAVVLARANSLTDGQPVEVLQAKK